MNSLNSILLEGNVSIDPTIKEIKPGQLVCNFSIACQRFFKQNDEYQKEISFFNITAWNRQAELCSRLKKGRGVRIVGRLKQDRWKDADGTGKSRVYIIAEFVEFKPEYKGETEK